MEVKDISKFSKKNWIDLILFFRPSVSVFSIVDFGAAGHNARVTNFGPFPCFIGHGLSAAEVEVVPKPKVGANCCTHPLPPSNQAAEQIVSKRASTNYLYWSGPRVAVLFTACMAFS